MKANVTLCRLLNPLSDGMTPLNLLPPKFRVCSLYNPFSDGIVPLN